LAELGDSAARILPLVDADEACGLPETRPLPAVDLQDWDASLETIPTPRKVEMALTLEKTAVGTHPKIKAVRSSAYQETHTTWALRNSKGLNASHLKSECSLMVMAVAEDGTDAESAYEFDVAPAFARLDPEKVGRRAAEKAVSYLGGTTPRVAGRAPVILDPLVACEVFGVLAGSFQSDEVFKNRSFLQGKLGERVYSQELNIIDDGLLPGGAGSWPFDGEGQPGRRLPLMEKGVLKNFLTDTFYGRKLGWPGNASCRRNGIKRSPGISYFNLMVQPGTVEDSAIFREVGEGVWVTEAIGMHMANPVSGDFSIGAQGFLIEKGEVARPVKKLAIAGNLHQMMADVQKVGLRQRRYFNMSAPTLVIREMTISGS
jgi:PmbA protein